MTEYRVAIPSYQRPRQLREQSLRTLRTKGVPAESIDVFLHDNDPHLEEYLEDADLLGHRLVVTKARGIGEQRATIVAHYPEGTHVVGMDDDIEGVISSTGPRWSMVYEVEDLDRLFREMFWRTEEEGLYVWGLNPVNNPFFFYNQTAYSVGLKLVMFTMFGWINRPGHPVHEQTVQYKDEQEFSLRAWWYDGAIFRNNRVGVKTVFYTDGGCTAAGRNYRQVEDSVVSLLQQWPDLIRRNHKKKGSEWPEVTLARRKRTEGHPVSTPPPGGEPLI